MRRIRWKKIRGRRNKAKRNVKVSDITADGFWIETYKEKYYISRKDFPWFLDATDEEILDVSICLDDPDHGDILICGASNLNVDLFTKDIADPSWVRNRKNQNIIVRGVKRPDLLMIYRKLQGMES